MKQKIIVAAIMVGVSSMHAQAGALDDGNLNISGFGTLGVAKTNTDQVHFVRYNQAEGVSDQARIGLDSNLGLQASYKANDWLSGTVQVLTRKGPSPGFTTDLTWAFVKVRVSSDVSIRVGRVVLPAFLISEYQNVGHANTMMRPPIEMYAQMPVENTDGVDLSYRHAFGELNFTAQPFVGVSTGKLFVNGTRSTFRAPNYGVSLLGEYKAFTFRFGHDRIAINTGALDNLANEVSLAGFPQLGSDLRTTDKKIAFTSVGATMDWKNIVLQTEYAQRRAKDASTVPDSNSSYFMVGYRIGKILPYYTHAAYTASNNSITLPTNFPKTGPLGGVVAGILAPLEQSSDLIGMRWDFAQSMALKFQIDRVKPKTKSGSLIGPVTGYTRPVTVVGATLDFVF